MPNTEFWYIAEFIVKDIALALVIGLIANFLSSKMENKDTIDFTTTIERNGEDNIKIHYNGKVEDFKTILKETDNFNEILNN